MKTEKKLGAYVVQARGKAKYTASKDLSRFAIEYHTLQPSKLCDIILKERNKVVTPESITMWFKRHPEVAQDLRHKIHEEELPALEVSESIFLNGTFEELPSIKNWIEQMQDRDLRSKFIRQRLGNLKRLCLGRTLGYDFVKEGKWCLKHPDRLNPNDLLQFVRLLKAKGEDSYRFKRDGKDFLLSKGMAIRIAVGKPKGYGTYARLFVEKPILSKMLAWVKRQNFEAYVIDEFMFKTGTRIGATLNALIEDLHQVEDKAIQIVYDKGRKSKYPKGHMWNKRIDTQLLWDLKQIIGDRKQGRIFNATRDIVSKLNRAAIEKYSPHLFKQYPHLMVNHFWRHMFFQHMLIKTHWNSAIAAEIGGSTKQSVDESYGKPPKELIKQWSEDYYIDI